MMDQDAEIEQAIAQVVEHLKTLRQRIADAEVPDEQTWFRNLLVGILNCAATDYRTVEIGVEKLVELAAWGCRNLLELRVLTEYVLTAEENAVAIQGDLVLDAKEFYEAVSKSHVSAHRQYLDALSVLANQEQGVFRDALEEVLKRDSKLGPQTGESDAEAEGFRQFQVSMGLKPNAKPKMAGEIADLIQQKADFGPLNKICSKLIHRTALSIASSTVQGSLDAVVPFLKSTACNALLQIFGDIKRYVETTGIQVPPKRHP
jgi:hypothetical protein